MKKGHTFPFLTGALLCITWLGGLTQAVSQALPPASRIARVEMMSPETLYSFTGVDGKGFLKRSPVNLPLPPYADSVTGMVPMLFSIAPSGHVARAELEPGILTASPEMIESARQSIMEWKFAPLPARALQNEEQVRVVIQFNHNKSGCFYSVDGRYTIEGLHHRTPDRIVPVAPTMEEGVVTVIMTINPAGEVAWIDRCYGAYPHQPARPRLGIITYEAVNQWTFAPLPPDVPQEDQQIKAVVRFVRWNEMTLR
ncbi:MAG: hypothetical protein SF053_15950 [Bacteroidia bacterium]|nr:hypothetical protein [Bacteroidia bacterium]